MMKKKWLSLGWKILAGLIFIPGLLFLFAWVFMLIWNALMPAIFDLPAISFWQGVGLIVLAKFLFGHISGGKGGRCKNKGRGGKKWKKRFKAHFDKYRAKNEVDEKASAESAVVGPSGEV